MPEFLTIPLAIDLAVCVAIAVVFYGFVTWNVLSRHRERDGWHTHN